MTNGPVAFVGGREFTAGCDFDGDLAAAVEADRVAVVPTGAAYEHPERSIEAARAHFGPLGIDVDPIMVLTRADASDGELVDRIARARFIYLTGESPMHLWSVMKDSPAWDAIAGAWHGGAALAGSSAGARVIGDPMVDPRGGAFTVGLGLVANLAVIPHHNELSRDRAERTRHMAPPGLPLVAIDEATALIRDPDGQWSVRGAGSVTVYLDGHEAGIDKLP